MIKLNSIKMKIGYSNQDLVKKCSKILKINEKNIKNVQIFKQSIDAREKPNIMFVLSVLVELAGIDEKNFPDLIYQPEDLSISFDKKTSEFRPVVVGFGPSGMFASLALARMGLKPIIIEQGKKVDQREKDVLDFWENRKINKHSNVQFGEGGAGTFSDGKLNSNISNIYCRKVIKALCDFGAPKEISYIAKPHIGSDKLKEVVVNLRNEIISLGGEFHFSTFLKNIKTCKNEICGIIVTDLESQKDYEIKTDKLLLCVGHSARSVFKMLYDNKVNLAQKPFAMGVRIEHKQEDVNISQYGKNYNKLLPNADYKLVTHLNNGRSVFTFCMCPGGQVVASSSDDGEVVTNGMSNFARDKENANSALLVNVMPEDYSSSHPLAGIEFQAKYEKLAFVVGGENFNAPAQTVGSFLSNKPNTLKNVKPSYQPNITLTQIEKCLPKFVSESLKQALPILNNKLHTLTKDDNLLIAVESRSSCPLTILRDENYQSNIKGLYPIGEGAGYAGGIISSAQDGLKVAEKIYQSL